jgi:hypothetical protein
MHAITYAYTDPNGCTGSAVDSIWVDVCSGLTTNTTGDGFDIYPNPNNGTFALQLNTNEAADVTIYDALGQLLSARKVQPGVQEQINIESSGVYMIVVITADGWQTSQRVIVNK